MQIRSWVGVVVLILTVTMNESAIDGMQNGLVSSFSSHWFKGQHLIFPRLIVLALNVPIMIVSFQGGWVGRPSLLPGNTRGELQSCWEWYNTHITTSGWFSTHVTTSKPWYFENTSLIRSSPRTLVFVRVCWHMRGSVVLSKQGNTINMNLEYVKHTHRMDSCAGLGWVSSVGV